MRGAIRVPPRARIVGVVHYLNPTDVPVTGHATLTVHPIRLATVLLEAVVLTFEDLTIPAMATSRFSGTCNVPITRVHYVQPNARNLASRVFAQVAGGPMDGTTLLDASPLVLGVPSGITLPSPADLSLATGITFGCEYANPRTTVVRWGAGDQEQCDVLAFVEAAGSSAGTIGRATRSGTSGSLQLFDGPCAVAPL